MHQTVERSPVVSVSTDAVPRKERLAWWAHMSAHEIAPTAMSSAHAGDFHGRAHSIDLVGVRVAEFTMSPLRGWRSPAHIRQHDPDGYQLLLVHDSPILLEQRRKDSCLQAGDFSLFDTSHPYVTELIDVGKPARLTILFLSGDALPLPRGKMEQLLAHQLSGTTGTGAILARFLTGLRKHAAGCRPEELPRLGTVAADLAATFLAGRLGAGDSLTPESRRRLLIARIDAFIDHHLGDPDLDPAVIAAHHHISVRTLHLLFQQRPETVSATIRRRRLERCLADLADPRLHDRPIGEISVRSGFKTAAEFSRAFRAAYGISPRDHRRQALEARLPPQ
ncbi:helix-turn-helix domain-containing protein [Nonomuraea sp. MG754425]|uniref:AraC-like ligand-binding domain-containing protein n=1 Tax=Nonomuraea sp. MG754425 TaxID=2570319 RepID=UPI001EFFE9BD|nr:helix-turn-helix domain-containing protein [Nonomuraea sp. MG754425]MCF6468528.1 helix-turn-helix domain-containing protein [Nonomuraea sp. MG754425]